MKQMLLTTLMPVISCIFLISSCTETYNRKDDCDLSKLNVNGDVTKIEIITQTSMPISEWLYSDFSRIDLSRILRNDAVYSFMGNSTLEFSNDGNVKSQIVFDNNGNVLYSKMPTLDRDISLYNPININVNELADGWEYEFDDRHRIIKQTNSHDGKTFLVREIHYNDKGDLDYVVCNFEVMKFSLGDQEFLPSDTTFFRYTKQDAHENWTEAEVTHNGRLHTDKYKIKVRRRITYYNESNENETPLIAELSNWNDEAKRGSLVKEYEMVTKKFFSNALSVELPSAMELEVAHNIPNTLSYRLNNIEGFFSVSVAYAESNETIYQEYSTYEAEEAFRQMLGSAGVIMLRWDGRNIVRKNNSRPYVYTKYFFYPASGYLRTGDPIITEIYQYQLKPGDTVYSVSIGYDSNHEYQYKHLADKIKNTITINQ